MTQDIIDILENKFWDELKSEEGITKEDVDLVMLEIEFSPVIPFKGDRPCEVTETIGGNYLVHHPLIKTAVSPQALKVMRYRYLSNRRNPYPNF